MRRAAISLLTVLLAVTACTGGRTSSTSASKLKQPPVASFAAGPCRAMAPDLLAIQRDGQQLGGAATAPRPVLNRLKDEQGRVRALQPALVADKLVGPAVEDLVIAVGVVRLNSDTNVYLPSYAADLRRAAAAAIASCTGAAPAPSPSS